MQTPSHYSECPVQRSAPLPGNAVTQGVSDIPAGLAHVSSCSCKLLRHQGLTCYMHQYPAVWRQSHSGHPANNTPLARKA